jgi:hypothetical protein
VTPDPCGGRRRAGVAVTLCLALACLGTTPWRPAFARDDPRPPLVGDRPDFTESAETVGRGRLQLETGATGSRTANGERETAIGELLLRVGLAAGWELRLGAGSWTDFGDGDGAEDASLGLKAKLAEGAGGRPDLALLLGVSLPTGSSELTADEVVPEVKLAAAWAPSERLGIGANLGWADAAQDGERYDQLSWSVAAGLALGGAWGGFLELYGFSREEPGGDPTLTVDLGVTRLIHPDLQLDARVGIAVDDGGGAAPDWFAGLGAVVRW